MHCVFPTESPAYLPVSGNVDVEAGERGVDEPLEGLQNLAVGVLLIELLHLTQTKIRSYHTHTPCRNPLPDKSNYVDRQMDRQTR